MTLEGETRIVKYLHLDSDFTMRVTGDVGCRPLRAFAAGLYDVAPDVVDHAVLAAAAGHGRNGWGAALLMRDVSAELMPPGDDPFSEETHAAVLDAVGALCARTWGFSDDYALMPYSTRWQFFSHAAVEGERALGWPEDVPRICADGWARFANRAPADVVALVDDLRHDVAPLATALAMTPSCFLHGDWKASNLGIGRDGHVVLLDWVYLGAGPACHELSWYLALNRAKVPIGHSKEHVVDDFRASLERHGVDTAGWWESQLDLSLLGGLIQFGWEKAFGDDAELGWWCDRARQGATRAVNPRVAGAYSDIGAAWASARPGL